MTTQLELWEGLPCSEGLFQRTFWGGLSMLGVVLRYECDFLVVLINRDIECWVQHMKLVPHTGNVDPEGEFVVVSFPYH